MNNHLNKSLAETDEVEWLSGASEASEDNSILFEMLHTLFLFVEVGREVRRRYAKTGTRVRDNKIIYCICP